MADLYSIMKGKTYGLAVVTCGRGNDEARTEGHRDVFDLLISDSDHARQAAFLLQLPSVLPDGHRKILLDGLAREYAGLASWEEYVHQEC
jgi:hypothetical protein